MKIIMKMIIVVKMVIGVLIMVRKMVIGKGLRERTVCEYDKTMKTVITILVRGMVKVMALMEEIVDDDEYNDDTMNMKKKIVKGMILREESLRAYYEEN